MPHYSATKLPDSDGDGLIKLSSARAPYKKGQTVKYCPNAPVIDAAKPHCYVLASEACPIVVVDVPTPTPPPVQPAPGIQQVIAGGEAFIQNDVLGVGFNRFGAIGTFAAAPTGFRTDTATGLARLGVYDPRYSDVILQGRAIEGPVVTRDGIRKANLPLTGFSEMPGQFVTPLTWKAEYDASLGMEQTVELRERGLAVLVTLENRGTTAIDVTYMRCADPDQSDAYSTVNRVVAPGAWECGLTGGGVFYFRSGDARTHVTTYDKAVTVGTPCEPGRTRTADEVVQLVWTRRIEAGQTATIAFEMGLRDQ